jgi:hypothetical protein
MTPPSVDIRDVGMRDGLQIEAPVPLAGKLACLTRWLRRACAASR